LKAVVGGYEVIVRGGNFDAFLTPRFAEAIEETGRRKLVFTGLMTEGCVLHTVLAALKRGYDAHVVADAMAGETVETHQVAIQRLIQAGAVPVTWLSIAAEYQVTYENVETVGQFLGLMFDHSPQLGTYRQLTRLGRHWWSGLSRAMPASAALERRTAANTAIVLIDYVTGFANMIRSQSIAANVAGARALAQTAVTFEVPLVVTLGPENDPRGVLYPEVAEVIAQHPIVHRGGSFDAFDWASFERAIAATERQHLVVAGLMTDGCVLQTSLSALRRDLTLSLVVDATACETEAAHQAALSRLTASGATLTSWLSFAAELQRTYESVATLAGFRGIQANSPAYAKLQATLGAAAARG
jgi:nicotinamidase-related amidase